MSLRTEQLKLLLRKIIEGTRFFIWPRGGYRRSFRYIGLRLLRLRSSDYALAIGFASGTFVSFTPFLGFHFIIAAFMAWALRGNIIASALGTFVGNPLTFPFIWATDYVVGMWILHGRFLSWDSFAEMTVTEAFYPLLIGAIPCGGIGFLLVFVLTYYLVRSYRGIRSDGD